MKEVTVQELKRMRDENEAHQLIDVREQHEADIASIGGELIPMGTILAHIDQIAKDKPVIIHCRSGARSASVVNALETQHGFTNLYNLKGGILAWGREIDPSVPQY
ncbi:MAG: rhodanese-like domain-containing protein [Bacteroidia bacterium]|jgi:adenylyltransferase/sulfurtransferase|nr:rhodanese-like domain-containing protein [Bacteroidia bacterium]